MAWPHETPGLEQGLCGQPLTSVARLNLDGDLCAERQAVTEDEHCRTTWVSKDPHVLAMGVGCTHSRMLTDSSLVERCLAW